MCPPIATVGSMFYFDPATLARGKEAGLDGFRLYMLGRGGVLGDVEAAVVHSAFGYFNPDLVTKIWNSAKETMAPRDGGRLYMECAGAYGSAKLAGIEGLEAFNAAADKVIDAGMVDPSAQALFAAIASEPRSDEAAARAYQNVAVLRELRGSLHLVAIVASGLSTEMAHRVRRPDDVEMFGWTNDAEVTDEHRAKWEAAEALTDDLVTPIYGVLDDAEAQALADGVAAIEAALSG
ncbi:SCO6745 family protein [Candidatus Poriferisodalis sp.]|uniref:SCO6745 family protein n=1 Tax=Candidatus Poriferisodalis sp. TaxID=3101277 RepID=UPI003B0296B6